MYTPFAGLPLRRRPWRSKIAGDSLWAEVERLWTIVSSVTEAILANSGVEDAKSPLSHSSFAHSIGPFSLSKVRDRIYHKGIEGIWRYIKSLYFSIYEFSKSLSSSLLSRTYKYGVVKTSSFFSVIRLGVCITDFESSSQVSNEVNFCDQGVGSPDHFPEPTTSSTIHYAIHSLTHLLG